jgi:hypothetical protein
MPLLPKVLECEYCKAVVFTGDMHWKCPAKQIDAQVALNKHLATCSKASDSIRTRVRNAADPSKPKKNIQDTDCPTCGKIMRSDKVITHSRVHDPVILVLAMPLNERAESLTLRIPIVKCYKEGRFLLRMCLHCKKGCLATSKGHSGTDATLTTIKRTEKHEECIKNYDTYKHLFEMKDFQVDLPFHLYNCNNPDKPIRKNYLDLEDPLEEEDLESIPESEDESSDEDPVMKYEKIRNKKAERYDDMKEELAELQRKYDFLERQVEAKKKEGGEAGSEDIAELRRLIREEGDAEHIALIVRNAKIAVGVDEEDTDYAAIAEMLETLREDVLRPAHRKIAMLEKKLAEKELHLATFDTIKFGHAGRMD